jgi:hypothetical protein
VNCSTSSGCAYTGERCEANWRMMRVRIALPQGRHWGCCDRSGYHQPEIENSVPTYNNHGHYYQASVNPPNLERNDNIVLLWPTAGSQDTAPGSKGQLKYGFGSPGGLVGSTGSKQGFFICKISWMSPRNLSISLTVTSTPCTCSASTRRIISIDLHYIGTHTTLVPVGAFL